MRTRPVLALLVLASAACATSPSHKSEPTLNDALLQQRAKALEALAVTALRPCVDKLKPDDHGLVVVLGKADGEVALGPQQWLGSVEAQQCITEEAIKARLPPYSGPAVSWLWSIGSTAHPAPGPVNAPADYPQHLAGHKSALQGDGNGAISALASCPLRTPLPDAYASLIARLFIFPGGQVAGATPIAAGAEGREPAFLDCAIDLVQKWRFSPFTGPGFVVVDVQLHRGIDPHVR